MKHKSIELNSIALDKACFKFIDFWNSRVNEAIPANAWNLLKPMLHDTIIKYLEEIEK